MPGEPGRLPLGARPDRAAFAGVLAYRSGCWLAAAPQGGRNLTASTSAQVGAGRLSFRPFRGW
eukprot:11990966-Alexandrium_andersonii.AAC.1